MLDLWDDEALIWLLCDLMAPPGPHKKPTARAQGHSVHWLSRARPRKKRLKRRILSNHDVDFKIF